MFPVRARLSPRPNADKIGLFPECVFPEVIVKRFKIRKPCRPAFAYSVHDVSVKRTVYSCRIYNIVFEIRDIGVIEIARRIFIDDIRIVNVVYNVFRERR